MGLHKPRFSPERTLWLVGLGTALSLLGDTTLYVVLPTHTVQAGILLADVGLMLAANRAIRIFLNSPYGLLIERLPRRRVLVPSLFLGALSTLLYILPGFWPLLLGRLLWGIAWAGIWLGGSTVVLDISTGANRGRLVGRYQMWGFIGMGAGALLGGVLTDQLGYRATFAVFTVIPLLMACVWWRWLPETRPACQETSARTQTPDGARRRVEHPLALPAAVVIMGLNWLIFMGMMGAILSLLLAERTAGWAIPLATLTGIVSACSQMISFLAAPLAGGLADHTGNRWLLVLAALIVGIAALLLTADGAGIVVIIGILLGAAATGVLQTLAITLAGDYAGPDRRGRILGVLNTVGDLGSAAGPLLAFALLRHFKLSEVLLLAAAGIALVLPAIFSLTRRELGNYRHALR